MYKNLDYEVMQKITAIILFDDVHTATAWRILENYTRIPVVIYEVVDIVFYKSPCIGNFTVFREGVAMPLIKQDDSEKTVLVVDCENSDPYKLCATLKNLDYEVMQKITAIIL